jgi:outer membrane protein assembly factor BamE (lipoprotein component of BamABCDE complex)
MSDGGKGSRPRPLSVTQEQYDNRWDYIFSRDKPKPADNTGVDKNEYQDVLSTEDCMTDKK